MFGKATKKSYKTPNNTIIYAVGDIHGRLDLLKDMYGTIMDHASGLNKRKILVFLGDYIDRGPESKGVVDYLLGATFEDFEVVFLKGNHEYFLEMFLTRPVHNQVWISYGGMTALQSYGINLRDETQKIRPYTKIAADLQRVMGQSHLTFFSNLKTYHIIGDYLFVHAGIRPNVALEHQIETDMIMIRQDFINTNHGLDKKIIFGHTIFSKPFEQHDKIGIDTGGYKEGVLTAIVLEGNTSKFLQVKG